MALELVSQPTRCAGSDVKRHAELGMHCIDVRRRSRKGVLRRGRQIKRHLPGVQGKFPPQAQPQGTAEMEHLAQRLSSSLPRRVTLDAERMHRTVSKQATT